MSRPRTFVEKQDCTIQFESESHPSVVQLFEVSQGDLHFWFGSLGIAEFRNIPERFQINLEDGRRGLAQAITSKTGINSQDQYTFVEFFGISRLK